MFNDCVTKLLEERPSYSMEEVLRLQASLLNYALQVSIIIRDYSLREDIHPSTHEPSTNTHTYKHTHLYLFCACVT